MKNLEKVASFNTMNICSKGDASNPTIVLFYYKTISAFVRTHFW